MTMYFEALADPRRRQIVELLSEGPCPVGLLVDQLPIAQSGVSRHLRILRECGMVHVEKRGQQRLYSLRAEPFDELSAWLHRFRPAWEARLDRFGAELARRQQLLQQSTNPRSPEDTPDD